MRQCVVEMADKAAPVGFRNPHTYVSCRHVASGVIHRAACTVAKKINQKLLLALDSIVATILPKTPQSVIRHQSRQQIVGHGRNRVVTSKSIVE